MMPKKNIIKRTVYWPAEIYNRLKETAKRKRRTVSGYVVDIAEETLEKEKKMLFNHCPDQPVDDPAYDKEDEEERRERKEEEQIDRAMEVDDD